MDTSSCMMAIERFFSRRGTPSINWLDNGTNFVGAEKELFCASKIGTQKLHCRSYTKALSGSIRHGGLWERMVRSCERVFYTILGLSKLNDENLNTTMCLVEGSLKARPLTPVSDDPDSLEALTPNHFLLGQHSLTFSSLRSSENYSGVKDVNATLH